MTAPVTSERDGGLLIVRLANPATRNAIDLPFAHALHDALTDLDGVGAIAILADGDHFSVGGNVRSMAASPEPGAFVRELADALHRGMLLLQAAPPVVVGVQGWAAGAGMSLVCACDVVIAAESASFQPAYPGIGVTPDGGMSWNLPRIVGERRARSIIIRNEPIDAARARELGLVDDVVADGEVAVAVLALARRLASGPRHALAGAKRLVRDGWRAGYAEQLDAEAASIAGCVASPEGREGITAFVERRAPEFTAHTTR